MQEAYIVFLRCKMKYEGEVDNAAWFMSLFKTALANRFDDLAVLDTKARSAITMSDLVSDDEDSGSVPEAIGELANEGELATMVRQAPREVQQVLALLLNAPVELIEGVSESWRARGKKSAFGSKRLCKLLGIDDDIDVLELVRAHFGIGERMNTLPSSTTMEK